MDRGRRTDARSLAGRHPPLRGLPRQRCLAACPGLGNARPALQDGVAAARAGERPAVPPLYDRLKARGAWFGNKMGWERPNWFAGVGKTPDMQYGWGRGAWFDAVAAEHRATREAVTVVDETSFGKLLVQGRDAEAALQRLAANDIAVP